MPSVDPLPTPERTSRTLELAVFGTSLAWLIASRAIATRAAHGLSARFGLGLAEPALLFAFLLFLLVIGFSLLETISRRSTRLRDILALPSRSTSREEWLTGVAIGWASLILVLLPIALAGALEPHLWMSPRAVWLTIFNLIALALAALAEETVFRGYPYRHLIGALGSVGATVAMAVFYATFSTLNGSGSGAGMLVSAVLGLLLCLGWLRTHGLWLSWGINFGWKMSMAVLVGLPVSGSTAYSSFVQTFTNGAAWLTGGAFGPQAALPAVLVLVLALVALVRLTRDYAWNYTHREIIAGGYPVHVAPPPAHAEMEAKAPSLVQILPSTPQSRSAGEAPE